MSNLLSGVKLCHCWAVAPRLTAAVNPRSMSVQTAAWAPDQVTEALEKFGAQRGRHPVGSHKNKSAPVRMRFFELSGLGNSASEVFSTLDAVHLEGNPRR